jgi:general stress protein YciG
VAGNKEKLDTSMNVREAGRLGGQATRDRYGHEFYEQIGRKGGRMVRELIRRGRKSEEGESNERE